MSIPPVDASGSLRAPDGAGVRAPKQTLDGDVFMQLLVTQLSNQDPSSPMDTTEMIAQTTQLASMERLNAMSDAQEAALALDQRTAAAALIGREATVMGPDATPVSGVVSAVSFRGTEPTITMGGAQYPYSAISELTSTTVAAEAPGL